MIDPSHLKRGLGFATGAAALLAITPGSALAAPQNQPGWTANSLPLTTGVINGYETAIDPVHRVLYAADAAGASFRRQYLWDPAANGGAGAFSTTQYVQESVNGYGSKVAAFSSANFGAIKTYSHANLLGTDGITPGGQLTWPANPDANGVKTASNNLTGQHPYGVAVDHATVDGAGKPDPTIVTVQTRTSSVAIYPASRVSTPASGGNPAVPAVRETDLIQPSASGLVRARTPVVDSTRHKAYVAGFNSASGVVVQFDTRTKAVEATIPLPGAVGLALDEATNTLYAGNFTGGDGAGGTLEVIDLNKVVTGGDVKDATKNAQAVVASIANAGPNPRPGFDPVGKKVFLANSNTGTPGVTVVDVDPASANYRKVIKFIELYGAPNAVEVDGERGLAYVPTLSGQTLAVIDTKTLEYVSSVPTTGRALDADVDPTSGTVFVSNQGQALNALGLGQLQAVQLTRPGSAPKDGATGSAGAPGPAGAAGAAGPAGKDGLNSLSLELSNLKLIGSKVSFTAPGAGVLNVKVTSGGRTIATGKRTATKAGNFSLSLTKTKTGKAKLKQKKALKGTLTATFTPAGSKATVQKSIKAQLKR